MTSYDLVHKIIKSLKDKIPLFDKLILTKSGDLYLKSRDFKVKVTNVDEELKFGEDIAFDSCLDKILITCSNQARKLSNIIDEIKGKKDEVLKRMSCEFIPVVYGTQNTVRFTDTLSIGFNIVIADSYALSIVNLDEVNALFETDITTEDLQYLYSMTVFNEYGLVPNSKNIVIKNTRPDLVCHFNDMATPASAMLSVILNINNKFALLGTDVYIYIWQHEMYLYFEKPPLRALLKYNFAENKITEI